MNGPPPSKSVPVGSSRTRGRRWLRRAAAVALGLATCLVLLEASLWIVAAFVEPESRGVLAERAAGERRILCIGDSNTYGVHLPAAESYPGQLQAMLDRDPENPWRVVNLGYPGRNSAQMRQALADDLELYSAEVVILWGGINNSWSLAESHLWELPDREERGSLAGRILGRVRTLKLLRILAGARTDGGARSPAGSADAADRFREGAGRLAVGRDGMPDAGASTERPRADVVASIVTDLVRARAICDEHGAGLLLALYPIPRGLVTDTVNPAIAEAARRSATPLVDLYGELTPLFDELGYRRLMLGDHHANALGNHAVARAMLQALMDAGLVEERDAWRGVETVREAARAQGIDLRRVGLDGRDLELEVETHDGWMFELAIAPVVGLGTPDVDEGQPIADLASVDLTREEAAAYLARRAQGPGPHRVRVRLPAPRGPTARPAGWRLWARTFEAGARPSDRLSTTPVDVAWSELRAAGD